MMIGFAGHLKELPSFLSTVSTIVDDFEASLSNLRKLERPPPNIYEPTRQIWLKVLMGQFSVDQAFAEASRLHDDTERRCAVDVLTASRHVLTEEPRARIT